MADRQCGQLFAAGKEQLIGRDHALSEKRLRVSAGRSRGRVVYVQGDKSDLKPGAKVFIAAAIKQPDGTLKARAWRVGRDGVTPPM
jgi:hypothetical protein